MKKVFKHPNPLFFIFILVIGLSVFVRFYNLNWGAPYYFHPDERNVASAVSRVNLKNSMNPEFFAYGSLPIYSAYFSGVLENIIKTLPELDENIYSVNFEQAILILRILSATLSVGIIFLVFAITRKMLGLKYSILASSLCALNVGLVQYAHFGTFEIWLTFLTLFLFLAIYQYFTKNSTMWLVSSGVVMGLLVAVKVSSIILYPLILAIIFTKSFSKKSDYKVPTNYFKLTYLGFLTILTSIGIFAVTSPFNFLDLSSFLDSMSYESSVALGTLDVFYTGGFKNTVPVFYQLTYVYPFILNPVNLLLFLISLFIVGISLVKNKNSFLILTLVFFLILFLSQSFFYVKWIRYYIPTIPFALILLAFGLKLLVDKINKKYRTPTFFLIFTVTILTSIVYLFSYYSNVLRDDTRINALLFLKNNADAESKIISEVYDLGIVPFNKDFKNITLYNFYELDDGWNEKEKKDNLDTLIQESDYIILPSQRILRNRILNKNDFPNGYEFYNSLDKFELIYSTPCDIFCRIIYIGDPIYNVEETANVFDRPTVNIYKLE